MNVTPWNSVLNSERHARLLADFDHICAMANIPGRYVHESMKTKCDAAEIDWVTNFRLYRGNFAGLVLDGKDSAESRCLAICGALLRNFIDARVISLVELLDAVQERGVPEPTVLIIPNLYVPQLPAWRASLAYDVLLSRMAKNTPTVVAVESMVQLRKNYGESMHQHLTTQYKVSH